MQFCALALVGPVTFIAVEPLLGERAYLVAILAATSPIVWTVGRRVLQDVPVAIIVLLCLGCAARHDAFSLSITLFCLLACREAAVLMVPAIVTVWLLTGGPVGPLLWSIGASGTASLIALIVLFGKRLPGLLKRFATGTDCEYARTHKGTYHRLLVDLMMVSPLTCILACAGWHISLPITCAAITIIGIHAVLPIRNLRFIIAADLLLRGVAALAIPMWCLPILIGVDICIAYKIRNVYDPVTFSLASAFGMPKQIEMK
ncbi:MAG: hypothetical protein WC551_07615 [Patescibacteria group bacterium]